MAKKTLETSDAPQVIVENIGSDLQVKGWDRTEILVKSSSDNDIVLEERDGLITVSCPSDCVLYVPQKANVEVKKVGNDARFRSVDGAIVVGQVGSDLSLRDVGSARVESVGTDFSARRVRGEISIQKIGSSALVQDVGSANLQLVGNQLVARRVRGDLKVGQVVSSVVVRDVDGQVIFDTIGSSLHLQDVSGGITAALGGTATIDFSPVSWQVYSIQAASDIRCHIPTDSNAEFEINCGAQRIYIKTPEGTETIKENSYTLKMGDGGAPIKLISGGRVDIISQHTGLDDVDAFEVDFGTEIGSLADEIAAQTAQQIEAQMEMLEEQMNAQMAGLSASLGAAGMSEERMRKVEERMELAKERARQRAEAATQRAQEKMERNIAATQRKADRKMRASAAREARKERKRAGWTGHEVVITPPPIRSQPKEPVSEEERMMILQMLQDQRISVDQAEQLLSALDGR